MDIRELCLKHVYGAPLTEAEQASIDAYTQTTEGKDYLQECQEIKDLLNNMADVKIKLVDHEAMVENFERTVRQTFQETIFRPWWEANSPPILLGLMAVVFILMEGWTVIITVLLGCCVLWLITDYFQRYYYAKILGRPDLYEYAKASRKRSDRILKSLPGKMLMVVCSGLVIPVVSYGTYWGYREYGIIVPLVVIVVLVETAIIIGLQFRKQKHSDPEVWDWWTEEIRE